MSNQQPIGIFDSGIGGLTVARAISRLLPEEQLIYFGDTAHMPYGDKSPQLIAHYADKITQFLLEEESCKAIVIACNTASAAAYDVLRDRYMGRVPIINVIDPMIEEVIRHEDIHHIGIIATRTTIESGVYQEKFTRRKPDLHFSALATPLLASMIEEGFHDNRISQAVIHEYLSDASLQDIQGLILACTHYPLIKQEINAYFNGRVRLFDSGEVVASKLKWILEKEGLQSIKRNQEDAFYVSDLTDSFPKAAKMFFGKEVNLRYRNLWD